ncbi:hypothetical protein LCGC14_1594570, partial [marine sediment metagenome]
MTTGRRGPVPPPLRAARLLEQERLRALEEPPAAGPITEQAAVVVAQDAGRAVVPGAPVFLTSTEALQFDLQVPADWMVKVTPGETGQAPQVRFVPPNQKELTLEEAQELIAAQQEFLAVPPPEVQRALGAVFPDRDVITLVQWAQDSPEEFLEEITEQGDTEETRALIARVFPDATATQIHDLFYLPQELETQLRDVFDLPLRATPGEVQDWFARVAEDPSAFYSQLLRSSFTSPESAESAEALLRSIQPAYTDEQVEEFFRFDPFREVSADEASRLLSEGVDVVGDKYRTMAMAALGMTREEVNAPDFFNRSPFLRWLDDNPEIKESYQAEIKIPFFQHRLDTSGDFSRSFSAGVQDVEQAAAGALRWLGLDGIAAELNDNAGDMRRFAPVAVGFQGWETLFNPRFWTTTVTRSLPFVLTLLPAGLGGMAAGATVATALGLGRFGITVLTALGATAASRPLEASLEAGGAFDAALDKGFSEAEAKNAATQVFQQNLALAGTDFLQFAAAFAPGPFKSVTGLIARGFVTTIRIGGKVVITGLTEAGEEAVQDIIQRVALGEEVVLDEEMKTAMAVGGIFGVGLGAGGDVLSGMMFRTVETLPVPLLTTYQEAFDAAKATGLDDQRAAYVGLNAIAETEEGRAHITNQVEITKLEEFKKEVVAETPAEQTAWDKHFDEQIANLQPIIEAQDGAPEGFRRVVIGGKQYDVHSGLSDAAAQDLIQSGAIEVGEQSVLEEEAYRRIEEVEGRKFGLEQTLREDPVVQYRVQITGRQVSLTHFISLREQSFPEHFTIKQALQLNPGLNVERFRQKGTQRFNRVPRDEALGQIVEELKETTGNPDWTADSVAERVEQIRIEQRELKELSSEAYDIYEEATAPEPEVALTPEQAAEVVQIAANIRLDKFSEEVRPLITEWVD